MNEKQFEVRRLSPDDLEAVVAIDLEITGLSRRGYFEKRLAAALREPEAHLQLGLDGEEGLQAYVLARVLTGEFGQSEASVLLEVIGVSPSVQGSGCGNALLDALESAMRQRSIAVLETAIDWTNNDLARFFAAHGFVKAPRHVIECAVDQADIL